MPNTMYLGINQHGVNALYIHVHYIYIVHFLLIDFNELSSFNKI